MSAHSASTDIKTENQDDDSDTDAIDFSRDPLPQKLQQEAWSPQKAFKSIISNKSDDDGNSTIEEARKTADGRFEITTAPLEGNRTRVSFLIRTIEESETTVSFDEAASVSNNPLSEDPPDGFDETEYEYVVSEEEAQCSQCSGVGERCNKCDSTGITDCPNENCYSGLIETDCGNCNGRGKIKHNFKKIECPNCNGRGRNKQGQCNTCGGTPPVGKTGKIECTSCGGEGVSHECRDCDGKGIVKLQQIKTAQYSIIEREHIDGHSDVKEYADEITWVEGETKIINSVDEMKSLSVGLPVESPGQPPVRAKVTYEEPILYAGRVNVDVGVLRFWVSGSGIINKNGNVIGAKEPSGNFWIHAIGGLLIGVFLTTVLPVQIIDQIPLGPGLFWYGIPIFSIIIFMLRGYNYNFKVD